MDVRAERDPSRFVRKFNQVRGRSLVLLFGLVAVAASACASGQIPGDPSQFAAANLSEPTAVADESADTTPLGPPVPTASPATATPEPVEAELPPETADDGQPIAENVATATAMGLVDACSLYEDPDRLSELLGEFWTLGPGVAAGGQCLWLSTKTSETSAVVSIELEPTISADDPGSTVVSDSGLGIGITVDGNEFRVNVVTNDLDPTVAVLNVAEAERRIADDIYERLTGSVRPEA